MFVFKNSVHQCCIYAISSIDCGGKSTASIFLNQYNFKLYFFKKKTLSLCPQVAPIPHQRNYSCSVDENYYGHTELVKIQRVGYHGMPSINWCTYSADPTAKVLKTHRRGGRNIERTRIIGEF